MKKEEKTKITREKILTASVREEISQDSSPGYAEARLHFFRTHEMEARLFMEAVVWPPKELAAEIRALRSEIDALNQEEFRKILSTCTLRRGVSEEDAFEWFRTMQYAYNASFQMQTTPGEPYDRLIETHEKGAVRFLDRMMFGIAEKKAH